MNIKEKLINMEKKKFDRLFYLSIMNFFILPILGLLIATIFLTV